VCSASLHHCKVVVFNICSAACLLRMLCITHPSWVLHNMHDAELAAGRKHWQMTAFTATLPLVSPISEKASCVLMLQETQCLHGGSGEALQDRKQSSHHVWAVGSQQPAIVAQYCLGSKVEDDPLRPPHRGCAGAVGAETNRAGQAWVQHSCAAMRAAARAQRASGLCTVTRR
jgi:hypothetical protein